MVPWRSISAPTRLGVLATGVAAAHRSARCPAVVPAGRGGGVVPGQVTAAKIRELLMPPERGRIFDAEGRSWPTTSESSPWPSTGAVVKKPKNRQELFERLSGPLEMPVDRSAASLRPVLRASRRSRSARKAQRYAPLLPLPLKEDVDEDTVTYLKRTQRGLSPASRSSSSASGCIPYAPLASHVVGYIGPDHQGNLEQYTAKDYKRNERVGAVRRRAVAWKHELHGRGASEVFEVDAAGGIVRELLDQHVDPVAGLRHATDHRPRHSAVRRAGAGDQAAGSAATCRST